MVKEMMGMIGSVVAAKLDGIIVQCKVTDAREVWGKQQIEITPILGEGSLWKNIDCVVYVYGKETK